MGRPRCICSVLRLILTIHYARALLHVSILRLASTPRSTVVKR